MNCENRLFIYLKKMRKKRALQSKHKICFQFSFGLDFFRVLFFLFAFRRLFSFLHQVVTFAVTPVALLCILEITTTYIAKTYWRWRCDQLRAFFLMFIKGKCFNKCSSWWRILIKNLSNSLILSKIMPHNPEQDRANMFFIEFLFSYFGLFFGLGVWAYMYL